MNICIAGKNNIAVDVCRYVLENYPQFNVYALTNKNDAGEDNWQKSYLNFANENKEITIATLEQMYDIEDLIFISLEYDRIIKPCLFKTKYFYNLHFSLLPAYKGVYPSVWPILNGEKYSGVTLHCMDSGIDAGDIIAKYRIRLTKNETSFSLYFKLISSGTQLVIKNIEKLITRKYSTQPQPIEGSTYYSKNSIDYSNLKIDLFQTATQIDRQIRAFYFPTYQLPEVYGRTIRQAKITKERSTMKCGSIINETEKWIKLATIDYNIILYKL